MLKPKNPCARVKTRSGGSHSQGHVMKGHIVLMMAATAMATSMPAVAEPVPLFNNIEWNSVPFSPPLPDALNTYFSAINVQGLAHAPAQVTVRIPRPLGAVDVTIDLESMVRRGGFSERDGSRCFLTGDPIACEIIPIPNLPDDQFSYRWSGRGQGYDLRLNVRNGHAVGSIVGAAGRFQIAWRGIKELRMEYFRLNDPINLPDQSVAPAAATSSTSNVVMSAAEAASATLLQIPAKAHAPNSPAAASRQLDVLILFTEQGRIAAGGNAALCSDTNGVLDVIENGIDDINEAFTNSGIDAEVGVVTVTKLSGWEPVPYAGSFDFNEAVASRGQIQRSPSIKAFRNAVGADIVAVLPASQTTFGPCGVAYVQRTECTMTQGIPFSPCIGAAFSEYSYYLSTVQCMSGATDTFTHEMGHVLGGEHNRGAGAASDADASFPYAFGYDNAPWFQTVMAQNFSVGSPPRLLQFSNPSVFSGGLPTGTATVNNALAFTNLIPATEALRTRPNIIFANGFDDIGACPALVYTAP